MLSKMRLFNVLAISAALSVTACGQKRTDTDWNENYRTVCSNSAGVRVSDDNCRRRSSNSSSFFFMYIPFMYGQPAYGSTLDSRYSYRDRNMALSSASKYRAANPSAKPIPRPASMGTSSGVSRGVFGSTASSSNNGSASS